MSNIVENKSGVHPLGRAVLVRYFNPEVKSSIIALTKETVSRMNMLEQRAVVIEVGPACWPGEPPRCQPGDRVLIARISGYQIALKEEGGDQYALVNDGDIFARLQDGVDHV